MLPLDEIIKRNADPANYRLQPLPSKPVRIRNLSCGTSCGGDKDETPETKSHARRMGKDQTSP